MAEAKTSDGPASAMIRAAAWTATPPMLSPIGSTSPVWTPIRTSIPVSRSAATDGRGASERGDRAAEGGEEAVAGGIDLRAAEAEELGADELVVIGQDLLPGGVTEAAARYGSSRRCRS